MMLYSEGSRKPFAVAEMGSDVEIPVYFDDVYAIVITNPVSGPLRLSKTDFEACSEAQTIHTTSFTVCFYKSDSTSFWITKFIDNRHAPSVIDYLKDIFSISKPRFTYLDSEWV
jgi:hypothetical protein